MIGAAGRGTTLISGAAGFTFTAGSGTAGFAWVVSLAVMSPAAVSATIGSGGGGGGMIFRMPRMRSPLGVVATRAGSADFGSARPFT